MAASIEHYTRGVLLVGVLIIRALLFGVSYSDPRFLESPTWDHKVSHYRHRPSSPENTPKYHLTGTIALNKGTLGGRPTSLSAPAQRSPSWVEERRAPSTCPK